MSRAATSAPWLGPYRGNDFRIASGSIRDDATIRQALWYFEHETITLPAHGRPVAGFTPGVDAFGDVRAWASERAPDAPIDYPPLVWIAAPEVIRGARPSSDATMLSTDEGEIPARLVPKIALNRSWFDASSAAYFSARDVSVRGTSGDAGFTIRTLWPEEFRLAEAPAHRAPLQDVQPQLALRSLMREAKNGGARSPFAATTLWQRANASTEWVDKSVLAFIVNGAQGDDDEAHGGHFALVTGRIERDGAIGNWLVNNFYTLDAESEKGILAAPTPLDNYLGDLNSGQAWYRPSYMLVAVLSDDRAAALVQSALGRVYNQLYRHQLVYYHPDQNCTSISVDTLRALGWNVPARGPSSRMLAWAGFPLMLARERSVAKAKLAFDYLVTDQTRMMPAAALEEIFASLRALTTDGHANDASRTDLAHAIAEEIDALVFLRFPQFPSSRAWGDAPAVTTREYRAMVPSDPSKAKIIPVPPRPFPDALRDPDLIPPRPHASDIAAIVWGMLSIVGIPWAVAALCRIRRILRTPAVGARGRRS